MKKKLKKAAYDLIKSGGVNAALALVVVLFIFIRKNVIEKQHVALVDWTMFTSIVAVLILTVASKMLQAFLMNKLEDAVKLTCDYENLALKYSNDMIVYDNKDAAQENLCKLRGNFGRKVRIPVICECKLQNCKISIKDSTSEYELPDRIREHFDELFDVHSTSTLYNQLHIRVNDWGLKDGKFVIKTSRTTYFDSMVTNRAMDFRWSNGLTVREQFEYGLYLHTLKESKLSNHIGINGFVESSDDYIIFVKRGDKESIAKRTYDSGVGAALGARHSLDKSGEFTKSGLIDGILHAVREKLKLPEDSFEEFSLDKNLIAAYRDIVEGGKPQLLFFIRSKLEKSDIEEKLVDGAKKNHRKGKLLRKKNILWIHVSELDEICILSDKIIYHGKSYPMMPSVAASIVMLIEYLGKGY